MLDFLGITFLASLGLWLTKPLKITKYVIVFCPLLRVDLTKHLWDLLEFYRTLKNNKEYNFTKLENPIIFSLANTICH